MITITVELSEEQKAMLRTETAFESECQYGNHLRVTLDSLIRQALGSSAEVHSTTDCKDRNVKCVL